MKAIFFVNIGEKEKAQAAASSVQNDIQTSNYQ